MRRSPRFVGAWIVAVAMLALGASRGGGLAVAAGSLLIATAALPWVLRLRHDPLDPVGLFSAAYASFFGIFSLPWAFATPPSPPPAVDATAVAHAQLLAAAGLLCCTIPASLVSGRALAGRAFPRDRSRGARLPLVFLVIAVSALAAAVGTVSGQIGYTAGANTSPISQLIYQLSFAGSLAILALALSEFSSGRRIPSRFLVIAALVQSAGGFVLGFKGLALMPFVMAMFAWVSSHGLPRWRWVIGAIVAAVVLLIPANTVYRAVLRGESATGTQTIQTTWFYLASRFRLIDHLAVVHTRTGTDFTAGTGSRYILLPAIITVPRVFWREKPVLDEAEQFSHTYWDLPTNLATATPITQIGDLIRNFGAAGGIAAYSVWGLFLGLIARVRQRRRSLRVEMFAIFLIPTAILQIEATLPQLVATISRSAIICGGLALVLLPRQAARGAGGPAC